MEAESERIDERRVGGRVATVHTSKRRSSEEQKRTGEEETEREEGGAKSK